MIVADFQPSINRFRQAMVVIMQQMESTLGAAYNVGAVLFVLVMLLVEGLARVLQFKFESASGIAYEKLAQYKNSRSDN